MEMGAWIRACFSSWWCGKQEPGFAVPPHPTSRAGMEPRYLGSQLHHWIIGLNSLVFSSRRTAEFTVTVGRGWEPGHLGSFLVRSGVWQVRAVGAGSLDSCVLFQAGWCGGGEGAAWEFRLGCF